MCRAFFAGVCGAAFLLRGKGPQLVGPRPATSRTTWAVITNDAYEAIDQLSPTIATAYLDFAGSADVRGRIRGHLGDRLVHEAVVGVDFHQGQGRRAGAGRSAYQRLLRTRPDAQALSRLGPRGLDSRFAQAWRSFAAAAAEGWVEVVGRRGYDALREVWLEVLGPGRSAPRTGHVVTF